MTLLFKTLRWVLCAAVLAGGSASAQEAAIRKALTERLPKLPKIDDITKSPIPGLFEVRFGGTEIIYTDAEGKYFIQGSLIELATMNNLTEARIDRLTHLPFGELPLKDALVVKQGNG
ncbi:MAG: disulfide isomerase DsbC N-terminal domain-containing protein, partial [Rubrivivax sp.]|nr:disulfide isomerase DsbC N-terminal domain-containing protein [Rubrivivax sp.]